VIFILNYLLPRNERGLIKTGLRYTIAELPLISAVAAKPYRLTSDTPEVIFKWHAKESPECRVLSPEWELGKKKKPGGLPGFSTQSAQHSKLGTQH
jgi:hypothetical protein